jgi:predicted CXXCH cytochrome family protein
MQVRVVRSLPADARGGAGVKWEYSLQTLKLTIGRGSFADVQLVDPQAALQHAVIRPHFGRLRIESRVPDGVCVNGVRHSRATLAEGDVVLIGTSSILIQRARRGAPVVLEVSEPAELAQSEPAARYALTLRDTRLTARLWSWALVLSVIAVFLIAPLSASIYVPARHVLRASALVPSDRLWQAGPLHTSHQFIGGNCNACHGAPFHRVANAQCTACHTGVQHHVDVRTPDKALFQEQRCGDCHVEHQEPSVLVQTDSRLCTDCHGRLDSMKRNTDLANVSDFGTDHPDFRLTMIERSGAAMPPQWRATRAARGSTARPVERSGLTFSHAAHMNPKGIKSSNGYDTLTCASCHQPDTSGRQMLPIRMETHCARCHSLRYDEHDPATDVPHGDLTRVFETLQAHFIRRYLDSAQRPDSAGAARPRRPGGETEIMGRDEQRRARDWADTQSLLIARELLEERVCKECHRITRVPGATGFAQWQVDPVRITENWLPLAQFSHQRHATTPCATCHTGASRSKVSSDVLMPAIGVCRTCHGGSTDATRLPSDCGMCHRFHLPGRGLFDASARQTQRRARSADDGLGG